MQSDAFDQWMSGYLEDGAAIRALCHQLAALEAELQPLEAHRKQVRAQLERIVRRYDRQRVDVADFGTLAITGGGRLVTWDKKALASLLAKLAAHGYAEIAEELAAARRETLTAPSLRITPRAKVEGDALASA